MVYQSGTAARVVVRRVQPGQQALHHGDVILGGRGRERRLHVVVARNHRRVVPAHQAFGLGARRARATASLQPAEPGRHRSASQRTSWGLRSHLPQFSRTLTEKMMTYALGRGLKPFDRRAVDAVQRAAAADGYRFQSVVREVVHSVPFRSRRGEEEMTGGR